jgi:hypothetical protein
MSEMEKEKGTSLGEKMFAEAATSQGGFSVICPITGDRKCSINKLATT